jgi:hypothetical protein
MIIEYRAYTMKVGNLNRFYQAQIDRGFDGPMSSLMRESLIGYFSTISGPVEQVIHLYSFDTLEDWRSCYDLIYSQEELKDYFELVRPLIQTQENTFLLPAPINSINSLFSTKDRWRSGDKPLGDLKKSSNLLIEQQNISLLPGTLNKYWEAYEEHALPCLTPLETNQVGSFFTLIGHLHEVYHVWYFDDMEDKQRRNNAVLMNPRWNLFLDKIRSIVVSRENKYMRPAPIKEMSPLFIIDSF